MNGQGYTIAATLPVLKRVDSSYIVRGLPRNNRPMSKQSTKTAIENIFDSGYLDPFVFRDPLFRFVRTIGKINTAKLTKLNMEGRFMTRYMNPQENRSRWGFFQPLGLASILPIQTTVLRSLCPNLRELTLHKGINKSELRDDDLENQPSKTDEERIDETVRDVVHALPTLQKLQFSNLSYYCIKGEPLVFWALAWRWEKFVTLRHCSKKEQGSSTRVESNLESSGK